MTLISLINYKFLLQGGVDGKVTAGNISISDQWADDVSYLRLGRIRTESWTIRIFWI